MRVTENTNFDAIRDNIHRSREKMENLQFQSSTLKKLNTPSDDPVGAAKVLETRTDKVNNDQFQMNAKMAEAFLNNSDHAIGELADIVVRAKEIAIGQSSGASSNPETRLGVAEEVGQLYQQAVAAANRRIADRYIFGGFKTNRNPVDSDGNYHGDDGQMMLEVGRDVFISMNVPGIDIFNTSPKNSNDARQNYQVHSTNRSLASTELESSNESGNEFREAPENVNVFNELQNLRIGLLSGDMDGIRDTLERFDLMHGQLTSVRAKIGSRIQGLQNTVNSLERHTVTNAQLTSQLEDADMSQVVSDLAKEETVFRSALASST